MKKKNSAKQNNVDSDKVGYIDPFIKEVYKDPLIDLLGTYEFSLTVPLKELDQVIAKIKNFMTFGIYSYRIVIEPENNNGRIDKWTVNCSRIEYIPESKKWDKFKKLNP
jgi:hypothetical protein